MPAWDDTHDVIVAGSGAAGSAAALAAAELGLRTVLLEKADELGGTTAWANSLWVGVNHLAAQAGVEDTREDVLAYMRFVGGDQLREENLLAFIDGAPEALEFFERCGIGFRLMSNFVDHYYPHAPGSLGIGRCVEVELISEDVLGELAGSVRVKADEPTNATQDEITAWGGHQNPRGWDHDLLAERRAGNVRGRGAALIIHLVSQFLRRGGTVLRGVGAERLVREGERVTGVVTSDGRRLEARHGVVLACGGYESNPELMDRFENLPGARSMFVPTSTGDAILMGAEVAASVRTIHNNMAVVLGFDVPHEDPRQRAFRLSGILELLSPHTMVVNAAGRRFADETYFQLVAAKIREFDVAGHRPANSPAILIFDRQYVEQYSFGGGEPGDEPPEWVARAGSIGELAERLGIDAANLEATVTRLNGFAERGVDEDFGRPSFEWSVSDRNSFGAGRPNPSLGTIAQAPFYGVQLHPAPFASAGLATNGSAQVLDYHDEPIVGLYAAGAAAAHTDYGIGYQAGYSLTSGVTFGYLAARHIAAQAGSVATAWSPATSSIT
jgi:3-oxosteroid 1-dehydrogenase